jgi:hypothetical protein
VNTQRDCSLQRILTLAVMAALVVLTAMAGCAPTTTAPAAPLPAAKEAPPQPAASPSAKELAGAAAVAPAVVPEGWQVYANPAGFAIAYPATWATEAEPDANNGAIHTQALKGPEGEVHLSWGVGFGGACPPGYAVIKAAQGNLQACYSKNANGAESWTQISHLLPDAGFSGRALTSNAAPASRDMVLQILSTLTFAPMPPGEAAPTPVTTYADPFAYCAAVGTIDAPDARYAGPQTPDSVLPKPAEGGAPPPFPADSVYWRCMDGKVYSCFVGANIPCWDKADTSTEPNTGMQSFCKDQPNAEVIPAVAAGRETIYEWRCKDGAPVMGKQVFQVDAQDFITAYWQEIPSAAVKPAAAALEPLSAETCSGLAQAMGKTLGVQVVEAQPPFTDTISGKAGTGCQAAATGTGKQFASPDAVVNALAEMLKGEGWTEDPQLAAGGVPQGRAGLRGGRDLAPRRLCQLPEGSADLGL